jgi:hypothetical protein
LARSGGERAKGSTFSGAALYCFLWRLERSDDMETQNDNKNLVEYQVGAVLYQVTPVFENDTKAEDITNKIMRLILKDHERKSIEP